VLTLTEDPLPDSTTRGLPLSFQHIPMRDHEPPSLESLDKAATFVQDEVRRGNKVMVHCLAGQGRTMCVIAAFLVKDKGMKPDEAIRLLRSLRKGAVEASQVAAVRSYAEATEERE
jgi:atypical dual specificity phosphatase